MGFYRNIYFQVEEMYCSGLAPIEIAERTGLHFEEVVTILQELGEYA